MPGVDFLQKMRELLQEWGEFSSDQINDMVSKARGYAGGKASGASRRERAEGSKEADEPKPQEDTTDGQYVAMGEEGKRFTEFPFNYAAVPEWIQVLPKPGTYHHPSYGRMQVTADDLQEFVDNFEKNVYSQGIPIAIDFEHNETDLAQHGAVGYVKQLRSVDDFDGGVEAQIAWTDRGEQAIESDAYKSFSPEWYDEWKHPKTGEVHHNVLVGGALTTRPFFKADVLAPLAASEGEFNRDGEWRVYAREAVSETSAPTSVLTTIIHPSSKAPSQPIMARRKGSMGVKLTEAQASAIAEGKELELTDEQASELGVGVAPKEYSERLVATETALKAATETLKAMETDTRRKRFTDIVRGRAEGTSYDGKPTFIGDFATHVSVLETLADVKGEDSQEFKSYVEMQHGNAEIAKQSRMFEEIGAANGGTPSSAQDEASRKAAEWVKEHPNSTIEQGIGAVLMADPMLNKRFSEERNRAHKLGS